jgi:hypothetical protein
LEEDGEMLDRSSQKLKVNSKYAMPSVFEKTVENQTRIVKY